jgi:hypothetical protein
VVGEDDPILHDEFFRQSMTDPHNDPTFNLPLQP